MTGKAKVNILLVDDQPSKLLTYEAILQDLDENLVAVNSAREAFDQLLRNDFAVVLVDVCMPELDGYQLASMIRDHPRFEKTAIIFISAIYLSELDRLRGYESGAVDYVPVPVVPEILRAKVKIFVELYRKTRELEQLNRELEHRVAERTEALQASNEKLRESEERLRLASEAAEFGTYDCNFRSRLIYCSPQMKRLLGYEAEGDFDFDRFLDLVHPADREAVRRTLFDPERKDDHRHRLEYRIQLREGGVRWLLDCGRAFFDQYGDENLSRVMGTVLDLTERKQVEERQLLLMAELDHRVKNILANVAAVTKLSSKRVSSVDDFVRTLDARIQAMSKAHSLLRRDGWVSISLHNYIQELLAPFINTQGKNIAMKGEPVSLLPKAAQSLALVLHELATNAVKHGSLSAAEGKVEIHWSRVVGESKGLIKLTWTETGGPRADRAARPGFGLTVIKAAAAELDADLDYDLGPQGLVLVLKGPIEQASAAPPPQAPIASIQPEVRRVNWAKCRVLIVEDEAVVALQVKTDLETAGHKVVGLATNVEQGMDFAVNSDFDVAFLDIRLGEELSTPVAERLLHRGIPFAFGTGFEDDGLLPSHLKSIPRLIKPYENESVARLVGGLLNSRMVSSQKNGWIAAFNSAGSA